MKRLIPVLMLVGVTGTTWAQLGNLPGGANPAGQLLNGLTELGDLNSALSSDTLVTGFNNIDDAINALGTGEGYRGDGLRGAGLAALNPDGSDGGNVTQGFNNGNPAFQGFAVKLSNGTPAAPLADAYVAGTEMVYSLLLPAYLQMDGPTAMLISAGEPLTRPLYDALMATSFSLDLSFDANGLPSHGAGNLGALPPLPPSDMNAGMLISDSPLTMP